MYRDVSERLGNPDDPLRKNPDTALLYYVLARVSIENDEMMQDAPERALNKLFISMVSPTIKLMQSMATSDIMYKEKQDEPESEPR